MWVTYVHVYKDVITANNVQKHYYDNVAYTPNEIIFTACDPCEQERKGIHLCDKQ